MHIFYIYSIYTYIYIYIERERERERVDGEGWGLSTLCHSCGFACQQMLLKRFPGPGYLRSEDGVVLLFHLLVNLYKFVYFSIYSLCDDSFGCFKLSRSFNF